MDGIYKIYGVKNCEIIEKLIEILDDAEVDYIFHDFRDHTPTEEQIEEWAEFLGDEYPINYRSPFYKKNKKHFDRFNEAQKISWIQQNYRVIMRPIIYDEFDELSAIGGRPERLAKQVFGLVKDRG